MRFSFEQEQEIRKSDFSKQTACTYLPNGYHVTTCYRPSSAMYAPNSWHYETFVWKVETGKGDFEFADTKKERELIADATEIGHVKACERILQFEEWKEVEE